MTIHLHGDQWLHAAEIFSSLPFLAVILTISLPVWLPMVIYRRVSGKRPNEGR
ncbi:MAG: hypothetical protein AB1642_11915 [Pseudomonadota bacterium]